MEDARFNRERRLVARFATEAFDRVKDRGLFSANIRARTAANFQIEIVDGIHDVLAEETARARTFHRMFEAGNSERILAANVDEAVIAGRRKAGNRHRLN